MTEKEFILSKEDFIESGWQTVIEGELVKESRNFASRFVSSGNELSDNKKRDVFFLLADLLRSTLQLDSNESPLSFVDRFDSKQLDFFLEIIDEVDNDEIKSRIADCLWIRTKNHKMAKVAAESYMMSAKELENFENWIPTADRLERALQLAVVLGRKKELYTNVVSVIVDLIERCNGEDPLFLSAKLMSILQKYGEVNYAKFAKLCEKSAKSAELECNFHKAIRYWEVKVEWHLIEKDKVAVREARLKIAECYEQESTFNLQNPESTYTMASYPLEQAIVAYKKAGGSNPKIEELKLKLREYQQFAVEELPTIYSDSVDLSEIYFQSEKCVSGKSFIESLKVLSMISAPNSKMAIRAQVEENRKKYVLSSLFPKKLFSSNGRLVAVQPSDGEEAILTDMFQYILHTYPVRTVGMIQPARNRILIEHPNSIEDFYYLLVNHPFVPAGREIIIARGLHAGLNGDFLAACHFLIPQIEESIRYCLIQCRIVPSSYDDKGIQDEYNLNRLLTNSKFTDKLNEVFSEDFIFDLRCVLVERFGANLRNDMAHGLLDHNSYYSEASIYFWWLTLRLYLLPHLLTNVATKDAE